MDKSAADCLSLPYTVQLIPEDDGSWFVQIVELPGCMSAGETPEEAIAMIREAMAGWLEVAREHGDHVAEPAMVESLRQRKITQKVLRFAQHDGLGRARRCHR